MEIFSPDMDNEKEKSYFPKIIAKIVTRRDDLKT
jgi:hypothetical protein